MADFVNKTKEYMRRNGLKKTVFAIAQKLTLKIPNEYYYVPLTQEEIASMKQNMPKTDVKISILVPAYKTNPVFFRELLDSVAAQIYPNWELIIADASGDDTLLSIVQEYRRVISDKSEIRYLVLENNLGISENTNVALDVASGEYIGLLDHDDVLTPDALYWIATELVNRKPNMIYSDEDKTDKELKTFYEPHRKKKLNLDLIMSNNYICHFTVMRAELMKQLRFRKEYDGAQDYDIILRCIAQCKSKDAIVHIPRILYHWRCHENSTAANTSAKMYAYESGLRAVEDYAKSKGYEVKVSHMCHLGFYRVEYIPDIFTNRPEVGAVVGPVFSHGRIVGGAMDKQGKVIFEGLPAGYSGYQHLASMQMTVHAGDVRNMTVAPQLKPLLDTVLQKHGNNYVAASLSFCEKLRTKGYRIVYDPQLRTSK